MAKSIEIRKIGRCIYCDNDGPFTDEHVIPFALGANFTLGEASCSACQKITSAVELHVCRPIAGMLRLRLGIQTRNKEKRRLIPQTIMFGERKKTIKVAPEEFPSVLSYPVFSKPGILEGRARQGTYLSHDIWSLGYDEHSEALHNAIVKRYGCTSIELTSSHPHMLMPFIAKVAHASAVALMGIDGFEPLVQNAAIRPDLVFDDLLGGGGMFAVNRDVLHYIEMRQIDGPAGKLIFVRFHWFANLVPREDDALTTHVGFSPPPFVAIVGRPIDDRLQNKLGFINIGCDGSHRHGIVDLPINATFVPAPKRSMISR